MPGKRLDQPPLEDMSIVWHYRVGVGFHGPQPWVVYEINNHSVVGMTPQQAEDFAQRLSAAAKSSYERPLELKR